MASRINVRGALSGSFPVTTFARSVFSGVVNEPELAVGGRLRLFGFTVIVTVALEDVSDPSVIV